MPVIPTPRSLILSLRNYHQFHSETNTFENYDQVVRRVVSYQEQIWKKKLQRELSHREKDELNEIECLIQKRYMSCSGRHLALSSRALEYECGYLNSTFTKIKTVADIIDVFWLILNGCGTGFYPETGILKGFAVPLNSIEWEIVDQDVLIEDNRRSNCWIIKIGDTVQSWVKSLSNLLSEDKSEKALIFQRERKCPSDNDNNQYSIDNLVQAFISIAKILSNRSGQLLTAVDIIDIINLLGLIPLRRRSSQNTFFYFEDPLWMDILNSRKYKTAHRSVCNDTVIFKEKPSRSDFELIFEVIKENQGSQPGLINGESALKKAPWFQGCDSCVTTLLPNKGVCTLSEINLLPFKNNFNLLKRVVYLTARMNYRQSFLNLDDGVLQKEWHSNNEKFRLCGVGLTGVALANNLSSQDYKLLNQIAHNAVDEMAKELGTAISPLITCVKPSGNLSKIMGSSDWGEVSEGIHAPIDRYIFNRIVFSKNDPLLEILDESHYEITPHPLDKEACLVTFPVKYNAAKPSCSESAISQLNRYKKLQNQWADHNVSNTIIYKEEEVKSIIEWLDMNWNHWVGLSFNLLDSQCQHAYLPQESVQRNVFYDYYKRLKKLTISNEKR